MNMYQISSECMKAELRKEQEKREINDSNGSQLIHQRIVVDYLFTDSTFPYCPPKCCCKMRHLTKWALSFLYPVTWSSLQGSQSTVNSTICLATYYHSFTSTWNSLGMSKQYVPLVSFRFVSHTHICKNHRSLRHNSTFKNRLSNNHPWQTIPGDVFEEHHSSPHPEGVKDQTTLHEKSSITRHMCVTTKLWAF